MTDDTFTLIDDGRITLLDARDGLERARRAEAAGRPVAVDPEERAAYLGVSAAERAAALASLQAPDFTLPDLSGAAHSLSAQRGRKVLLVVWASW